MGIFDLFTSKTNNIQIHVDDFYHDYDDYLEKYSLISGAKYAVCATVYNYVVEYLASKHPTGRKLKETTKMIYQELNTPNLNTQDISRIGLRLIDNYLKICDVLPNSQEEADNVLNVLLEMSKFGNHYRNLQESDKDNWYKLMSSNSLYTTMQEIINSDGLSENDRTIQYFIAIWDYKKDNDLIITQELIYDVNLIPAMEDSIRIYKEDSSLNQDRVEDRFVVLYNIYIMLVTNKTLGTRTILKNNFIQYMQLKGFIRRDIGFELEIKMEIYFKKMNDIYANSNSKEDIHLIGILAAEFLGVSSSKIIVIEASSFYAIDEVITNHLLNIKHLVDI